MTLQVANTWRATQDISLDIQATWGTVMNNLEGTKALARFAGPGAWNDADMLEVTNPCLYNEPECVQAVVQGDGGWIAVTLKVMLPLADSHSVVQSL